MLSKLERPNMVAERFTRETAQQYEKVYKSDGILGWMHPVQVDYIRELTRQQHALGVYGTVGEIGVQHGLFFLALAGYSHPAEPLVAIDLFEDRQYGNIDKSGDGSLAAFKKSLNMLGIDSEAVRYVKGDSTKLSIKDFQKRGFPAFRLMSVDGGHTLEATMHDLMLATCSLADGGIIVLDDINSLGWFGVIQGVVQFLSEQVAVAPFLYGNSKMYLTTTSHYSSYLDFVLARNDTFRCQTDLHVSRVSSGRYRMCLSEYP